MSIKNIFRPGGQEGQTEILETLVEKAMDYGKTSVKLAKLKALRKATEVVSSFLSHSMVMLLGFSALLFLSLGLAMWLGELLGRSYYGYLLVAAFYLLAAIVFHFLLHKWLMRVTGDRIIKRALK
jgi:sterol desaturase/sphingolipid hydroxylase (fatty acid hydroxylase superfamily)